MAGAKRGGGGHPFLPISYPLPLSTPATQAITQGAYKTLIAQVLSVADLPIVVVVSSLKFSGRKKKNEERKHFRVDSLWKFVIEYLFCFYSKRLLSTICMPECTSLDLQALVSLLTPPG